MRTRMVSLLCAAGLLLPGMSAAFFEGLDALQREFEQMESAQGVELSDLLRQLETQSGTASFTDVPRGAWFERYVSSAARWGIVSGYKDAQGKRTGAYGPGDPVRVGEVLKMALKAAGTDETQCAGAPRMAQARGHWARAFVVCGEAMNMRLLRNAPDLDRPATRAEVLSVIHDAFGDRVPPLFSTFEDAAGHPLESDVAYAAATGIVTGDKDAAGVPTGTFRPDDEVNRAEAAKMLYEKLRVEAQ